MLKNYAENLNDIFLFTMISDFSALFALLGETTVELAIFNTPPYLLCKKSCLTASFVLSFESKSYSL